MAEQKWKIDFFNNRTKNEYELYFEAHPSGDVRKANFERDVTNNPLYHQTYRRIKKLKGKYENIFRWSQSDTTVIYQPHQSSKIVYPLETGSVTDISYKKRSKRKKHK